MEKSVEFDVDDATVKTETNVGIRYMIMLPEHVDEETSVVV